MATITKRLCLPVGAWTDEKTGRQKTEYREIGVEVEFSSKDGNTWTELRLNADMLNPVLFNLAKQMMERGTSTCRVKKFDVPRKSKTADAGGEGEGPPGGFDDEAPF